MGVRRAAIRRCNFELGIKDLDVRDLHLVCRMRYSAPSDATWCENEIDYVLVVKKNLDASPNPEEVMATRVRVLYNYCE